VKPILELQNSRRNRELFRKKYPDAELGDDDLGKLFDLFDRRKPRMPNPDVFAYPDWKTLKGKLDQAELKKASEVDGGMDLEDDLATPRRGEAEHQVYQGNRFVAYLTPTNDQMYDQCSDQEWCIARQDSQYWSDYTDGDYIMGVVEDRGVPADDVYAMVAFQIGPDGPRSAWNKKNVTTHAHRMIRDWKLDTPPENIEELRLAVDALAQAYSEEVALDAFEEAFEGWWDSVDSDLDIFNTSELKDMYDKVAKAAGRGIPAAEDALDEVSKAYFRDVRHYVADTILSMIKSKVKNLDDDVVEAWVVEDDLVYLTDEWEDVWLLELGGDVHVAEDVPESVIEGSGGILPILFNADRAYEAMSTETLNKLKRTMDDADLENDLIRRVETYFDGGGADPSQTEFEGDDWDAAKKRNLDFDMEWSPELVDHLYTQHPSIAMHEYINKRLRLQDLII